MQNLTEIQIPRDLALRHKRRSKITRDGPTDGPTDGRTRALIEMRRRI